MTTLDNKSYIPLYTLQNISKQTVFDNYYQRIIHIE